MVEDYIKEIGTFIGQLYKFYGEMKSSIKIPEWTEQKRESPLLQITLIWPSESISPSVADGARHRILQCKKHGVLDIYKQRYISRCTVEVGLPFREGSCLGKRCFR